MSSRAEMETIISFTAADKEANIYSADPVWMRKIEKLPGARKYGEGVEVDVPKSWIKIIKPRDTKQKKG